MAVGGWEPISRGANNGGRGDPVMGWGANRGGRGDPVTEWGENGSGRGAANSREGVGGKPRARPPAPARPRREGERGDGI
ncbi:hypothetical protein TIFTF001_031102 [Ficus carica]|uniref:Uncharacterized protein n=1 Tax=Ficus carica TaxID=3494 RepID=A0AA88DUH2_FICCA|nr:hypothetical protein TIFTF001_031102 [Ficus carica]